MYAVAFAVDQLGDIYLDARLPLSAVTPGRARPAARRRCSTYADESFNTILELGFASSIRKEWEWRNLRGESTAEPRGVPRLAGAFSLRTAGHSSITWTACFFRAGGCAVDADVARDEVALDVLRDTLVARRRAARTAGRRSRRRRLRCRVAACVVGIGLGLLLGEALLERLADSPLRPGCCRSPAPARPLLRR